MSFMDKILLDPLDKLTTAVFAITLSFTFCGLFLLPNARSILSNLLAASIIFGLINLIVNKQNNIGLIDRKILWVFLAYALFTLVNRFVHGDQFGIMRGLIYVVLFGFLIPRKTIIISVTRYSILAGGIGIGLLSLYQQHKGIYRVDGFTNAIMYSQASLVLLILNIVSYKELNGRLEKVLAAVSFTGCLFSLYASQSRGVWLALLFILVMAFILALIKNPVKFKKFNT